MKRMLFLAIVMVCLGFSVLSAQKYEAKESYENGVKIVKNPDIPKEGKYDLILKEVFTTGEEKDIKKYTFSIPNGIEVDKKGNIYVLDKQSKIFVFDKNGNYLKQFGRKGEGPGEFISPSCFAITGDNKIILYDFGNFRFCFLDLNGKYINGFNTNHFFPVLKLDSRDNIYAAYDKYDAGKISNKLQDLPVTNILSRLDNKTGKPVEIAQFQGEFAPRMRKGDAIISYSSKNNFFWNISSKDNLYTAFTDNYEISKYNLENKLLLKFSKKYSHIANRDYKGEEGQPVYLPVFTSQILFDTNGNLWVELQRVDEKDNYVYDVFTDNGLYLKQVFSKYEITTLTKDLIISKTRNQKTDPWLIKGFKYSLKKRS